MQDQNNTQETNTFTAPPANEPTNGTNPQEPNTLVAPPVDESTNGTDSVFNNPQVRKIYDGDVEETEKVIEYSMPTSSSELKGFYISADGDIIVTVKDSYETILEVEETLSSDNIADQPEKLRACILPARGNWLTIVVATTGINTATKVSIYAEF